MQNKKKNLFSKIKIRIKTIKQGNMSTRVIVKRRRKAEEDGDVIGDQDYNAFLFKI